MSIQLKIRTAEATDLLKHIDEVCPILKSLPKPLKQAEAESLLRDYTVKQVRFVLNKMEDWNGITSKKSVFLTAFKWLTEDKKAGVLPSDDEYRYEPVDESESEFVPVPKTEPPTAKQMFLDKHPVGSDLGDGFTVESADFVRNKSGFLPIVQYIKSKGM